MNFSRILKDSLIILALSVHLWVSSSADRTDRILQSIEADEAIAVALWR